MLQRCFRQAPIAGVAQIKAMCPLADCAFNSGPPPVALLELFRLLTGASRLQSFVLRLGPQLQHARTTRCPRTRRPLSTVPTRLPLELDLDHRIPILVVRGRPALADL